MSRHKIIKNMDLDDELDDFDGGDDYDYDGEETGGIEELSAEDQEKMIAGTIAVRAELGDLSAAVVDKDIHDALWNYYWDVGQTVEQLRNTFAKKENKKRKKPKGALDLISCGRSGEIANSGNGRPEAPWLGAAMMQMQPVPTTTCRNSSIPEDFWSDMAWFNIPRERQTLLIPPRFPRCGLLGGSPDAVPKMSKLQALAAARKKKALEQKNSASLEEVEKPLAKLEISSSAGHDNGRREEGTSTQTLHTFGTTTGTVGNTEAKSHPERKRKSSSPHRKVAQPAEPAEMDLPGPHPNLPRATPVEQAQPSAFASIIFGASSSALPRLPTRSHFTFPYCADSSVKPTNAFAGPSPDDVVIAAQSKAAAKSSKGPAKTSGEKKADQIAQSVESLKLDDTPMAKSKNLDVLAEFKKSKAKNAANFVVIGHVDAGKSTLMGRLLYDLKVVDQRTIDKYRKEAEKMGKASFALAWVLDQGTEERSRGVTIDIATNKFETEKTTFTILDAPGHRDFIPNMIAGASQADFAVLVIDASTGSFESGLKGQTKEHALLVRSMGVQRLIIAINKLDNVAWSQDRFDEISQQVSAFLTNAGFLPKNITYIPLSGLLGDNITRRSTEPAASWYTGPTLVEALEASEPVSRALEAPLRLTIGDVFRGGIQNPLSISGRIEAGSLQAGDALLAMPANQKCFIKSIEIDSAPSDWAVAGQNVTLHLADIDPAHLKIGDVLCSPSAAITCVTRFTAKVLAFEFLLPMGVDVHRGRLHAPGKIVEVSAVLDKASGAVVKKRPRIVKPGSIARVVVELELKVPLEAGLRIVLRSGGETIGAGLLE